MKKLLSLLVLLMSLAISSHTSAQTIKQTAKEISAECPIDMGGGLSMTSVEAKNKTFIYNIFVSPDGVANMNNVRESINEKRQTILKSFSLQKDETLPLFEALKKEGYSMRYVFYDNVSEPVTISFSIDELFAALEEEASANEILLSIINETKKQLPIKVDEVTNMVDLAINGDDVVYTFYVNVDDETFKSLEELTKSAEHKAEILSELMGSEVAKQLVFYVVSDNKNLVYKYVNESGKCSLLMTHKELAEALAQASE